MNVITEYLKIASDFIWGPRFLIPLLLGSGLFLTIRLRAIQLRQIVVCSFTGIAIIASGV